MPRWMLFSACLCLCGGNCGGPRPVAPVSLERADRFRRAGKLLEAGEEYARVLVAIRDRTDFEAEIARARSHRALFEAGIAAQARLRPEWKMRLAVLEPHLSDPTGREFLGEAMECYLRVLTGPSGSEIRAEASTVLSEALEGKAADPKLRVIPEDDSVLQHALLLEAAAAFEHRRLALAGAGSRERLSRLLRAAAADYGKLAAREALAGFAKEALQGVAESYQELAMGVERDKSLPPLPADFARLPDFTMERHLREAMQWADRSAVERTSRGDFREAERGYRNSLRHFLFAAESVGARTAAQENALSAYPGVAKAWRSLCLEGR